MKINKTVTVALDKEEIAAFAKAMDHLNYIHDWGETHEDELPEPTKPLSKKAYDAYYELYNFLQWMGVDTDEIEDNFELDGCE